eukprot:11023440-Karenia_brevis.AAC.1
MEIEIKESMTEDVRKEACEMGSQALINNISIGTVNKEATSIGKNFTQATWHVPGQDDGTDPNLARAGWA